MIYSIEIIETFSRVVDVKADDYDDAKDYVMKLYGDEKIILDRNDIWDVDFSFWGKDESGGYDFDVEDDYDEPKESNYE